jgi:hypothetical protein
MSLVFAVLEAGLEPACSVERYPLKIVCLPNSTTPAFNELNHQVPIQAVPSARLSPAQ